MSLATHSINSYQWVANKTIQQKKKYSHALQTQNHSVFITKHKSSTHKKISVVNFIKHFTPYSRIQNVPAALNASNTNLRMVDFILRFSCKDVNVVSHLYIVRLKCFPQNCSSVLPCVDLYRRSEEITCLTPCASFNYFLYRPPIFVQFVRTKQNRSLASKVIQHRSKQARFCRRW